MLLRMATSELSRRVLMLVAGIVALAVVIGLCVVANVVLFDRFTAGVGKNCPESGCRGYYACNAKGRAADKALLRAVRRLDAAEQARALAGCDSGAPIAVGFRLRGTLDQAADVVRRTWECAREGKPKLSDADRYFVCRHDGKRFDLDLDRDPDAATSHPRVEVEARPVR
jgi:hypothetical protein